MNKLKLISALLISLLIGITYAKDVQKINDQAEEVIYLYAEIIDSKNFPNSNQSCKLTLK